MKSLTLSLVLGACGGGSGASSSAPPIDASVDAPAVDASVDAPADAPMPAMPTITSWSPAGPTATSRS